MQDPSARISRIQKRALKVMGAFRYPAYPGAWILHIIVPLFLRLCASALKYVLSDLSGSVVQWFSGEIMQERRLLLSLLYPKNLESWHFHLRESSRESMIINGSILNNIEPFMIIDSRGFGAVEMPTFEVLWV